MRKPYTTEQKEFIRAGFQTMRVPELTVKFNKKFSENKTQSQIKGTISREKITCGRRGPGKGANMKMTPEQVAYIKKEYPNYKLNDLVKKLNEKFGTTKTFSQLKAFVRNHKIHSGRSGQFKKGHRP